MGWVSLDGRWPLAAEVRVATPGDVGAFLALTAEVEEWFGATVDDPGFRAALERNLERGTALCLDRPEGGGVRGGIFFSLSESVCRISWLVVSQTERGRGVGQALVEGTIARVPRPGRIDVVTYGADHPAAEPSGARRFYEKLGFVGAEAAEPGPDGTSRQWYRLSVPERDYLPPGGPDPEDYARALAAGALPAPLPSDLGTVFVNYIDLDEDHWSGLWQRGTEHRDINGSKADVLAWARTQRASRHFVFDEDANDYVPLSANGDAPQPPAPSS